MSKSKILWTALGVIVLMFALGIYFYPQLPSGVVVSHWGAQGNPNGYMPKFWGVFLLPIISIVLFVLFIFIPKLDPLKKNWEQFKKQYYFFILTLMLFLLYVHVLSLLWNLGFNLDMASFIAWGLGVLFYAIGFFIKNVKRNWFFGIRTPWTLNSDQVWEKTHKRAGTLFKISGLIAVASVFVPDYSILIAIIPIIASAIYLVVFSYFEFKKEART